MKKNESLNQKRIPEIRPLPRVTPYSPGKTPEIIPNPDKNEPYRHLPEIPPNANPEIRPEKGRR